MVRISVATDNQDSQQDKQENDVELSLVMAASAPEVPKALARQLGIVARKASVKRLAKEKVVASKVAAGQASSPQNDETAQADLPVSEKDVPSDATDTSVEISPSPQQNESDMATEISSGVEVDGSPELALSSSAGSATALLENPETEKAVDEIVAREGDALLAVDDARLADIAARPEKFGKKLRYFFGAWWRNVWLRAFILVVIFGGIGLLAMIPRTRYFALNYAGVRSGASLTIIDASTQQPLKSVSVQLGQSTEQTDAAGVAKFAHLKLGLQTLRIKQTGFAILNQPVTLGWGSNPLGSFTLTATGIQYAITVQDYLSGKAIAGATATSASATAQSDKRGVISLTLAPNSGNAPSVTIAAIGYRSATVGLTADTATPKKVVLVPSGKAVFVAKTASKYNVYDADVDGQNQQLLLAGTGSETTAMSLVTSPANDEAALVSLRNNSHDSTTGSALNSLTLIRLADDTTLTIDSAQQIHLIAWSDTSLIYELTTTTDPTTNPQRSRLMSYDYASNTRVQLAAAGQFTAATGAQGVVYYAASASGLDVQPGLFSVNSDGSNRHTITMKPILGAFRADYNTLDVQAVDGWYAYDIGAAQLQQIAAPAAPTDHVYIASPNGQRALWIGTQSGGQDALFIHTIGAGAAADTPLQTQTTPSYPAYWTADDVVVSQLGGSQPADYASSLNGGVAQKITSVVPTSGFTQGD